MFTCTFVLAVSCLLCRTPPTCCSHAAPSAPPGWAGGGGRGGGGVGGGGGGGGAGAGQAEVKEQAG